MEQIRLDIDMLKEDMHEISERVTRMDERQLAMTEKLDAILLQLTKSNERQSLSEKEIIELKLYNAEQKGQWKAIVAMGAVVGALVTGVINYFKDK